MKLTGAWGEPKKWFQGRGRRPSPLLQSVFNSFQNGGLRRFLTSVRKKRLLCRLTVARQCILNYMQAKVICEVYSMKSPKLKSGMVYKFTFSETFSTSLTRLWYDRFYRKLACWQRLHETDSTHTHSAWRLAKRLLVINIKNPVTEPKCHNSFCFLPKRPPGELFSKILFKNFSGSLAYIEQ